MNKPIRITGYVDQADVLEPYMQRAYKLGTEGICQGIYQEIEPIKKYRLFLMASSLSDVMELVTDVQHREFEWCMEHSPQGQNDPPESRISYENGLIFESLYQPRLEGELKNAESDLDLLGKYVQVVGYVQQQELGNCFLSFHIVEPAVHPADGFDR